MKTIILVFVLLIPVMGVNAQPDRNMKIVRDMNIIRQDSGKHYMIRRPQMGQSLRRQRELTLLVDQFQRRQQGLAFTLKLSDEQREAFKKNMLEMHKEIQPLRNLLGEALAHQKTLMSSENPDISAINENLDKIGVLKTKIAKISVRYRIEMRSRLNEEQRIKLDLMRGKMKHGMDQDFAAPGMRRGKYFREDFGF